MLSSIFCIMSSLDSILHFITFSSSLQDLGSILLDRGVREDEALWGLEGKVFYCDRFYDFHLILILVLATAAHCRLSFIYISMYLSISVFIYLSIYLSIYLFISPSIFHSKYSSFNARTHLYLHL